MIFRKKPETLVLLVVIVCTLAIIGVFLTDLLLTRQRDLASGEQRLQRFSLMMAEHTARAFEAIDILLREMASDLSNNRQDWDAWEPSKGWEYVTQRHSKSMPQLRDLIIFDRDGAQRFISTYFPPPQINVKDRPYFQTLMEGSEATSFGPYLGRNSGRFTYAIARRIHDRNNLFSGVVFAAMEPNYLQDFCWSNRVSDDFEAVLINAKNQIVASCRPTDLGRLSPLMGALASDVLFDGKLKNITALTGLSRGNDLLVSISPVPGFADLRILTAIPEKTLLTVWRSRMLELGTLGALVSMILLIGASYIRRQLRDMATLTEELASSHNTLTERVQSATAELAGEKKAAERANKAKSRFLAAASHDLRQPLHALSLFAADLQRQVRSGVFHEPAKLAEQISSSTAAVSELLDSLLDISRLDVAGIKPDIHPFALNPIFQRLNNAFRRAAVDRNQTLRFRPSTAWLASDPIMIERIMANLISNALRYTPPNGTILVAARQRGSEIRIEIRDNGVGIAPEHQSAIFAEFYQVGNPAREQNKGLGLGLSIIDRLTRALKINLTLHSKIGAGTCFAIHVPASQPSPQTRPENWPEATNQLHFIGSSSDLLAGMKLVKAWNYVISSEPTSSRRAPPANTLLIIDAEQLAEVHANLPPGTPLIVLTDENTLPLPTGAHALPTPIRPSRLRALLNQLQKVLPKSMP